MNKMERGSVYEANSQYYSDRESPPGKANEQTSLMVGWSVTF